MAEYTTSSPRTLPLTILPTDMAVAPIPGVQKVEEVSAWPSPVAHLSEKLALPLPVFSLSSEHLLSHQTSSIFAELQNSLRANEQCSSAKYEPIKHCQADTELNANLNLILILVTVMRSDKNVGTKYAALLLFLSGFFRSLSQDTCVL